MGRVTIRPCFLALQRENFPRKQHVFCVSFGHTVLLCAPSLKPFASALPLLQRASRGAQVAKLLTRIQTSPSNRPGELQALANGTSPSREPDSAPNSQYFEVSLPKPASVLHYATCIRASPHLTARDSHLPGWKLSSEHMIALTASFEVYSRL